MKKFLMFFRNIVLCSLALLVFAPFSSTTAQTQPVVPFYRFVRFGPPTGTVDYYFYSTSPAEATQVGFPNSAPYHVAGYIYTVQIAGTVPFHRFYLTTPSGPNRYIYSTDRGPENFGFIYDGIAGYVFTGNEFSSGVALTRLRSQTAGAFQNIPLRHFFTSSNAEVFRYTTPNPENGGRGDWLFDSGLACIMANPIEEAGFFARQQYVDILNRTPGGGEESGWTNYILQCGLDGGCRNSHRITTARGFLESPEFRNAHPIFANPGTPEYNREYVRQSYLAFLRREPDQSGWDAWTNYINNTGDYDTLVGGFINSWEYHNRFRSVGSA